MFAFYTATKTQKILTIANKLAGFGNDCKRYTVSGKAEARKLAKELGAVPHNF